MSARQDVQCSGTQLVPHASTVEIRCRAVLLHKFCITRFAAVLLCMLCPCRMALLVSAGQPHLSHNCQLLGLTLQDFGCDVTLLADPTAAQLAAALQHMQTLSSATPSTEDVLFYYEGSSYEVKHEDGTRLQLLEVAFEGGTSSSRELAAVVDRLEQHCMQQQCPALVHLTTTTSSCQPTQQQTELRPEQQPRFSHRTAATGCHDSETLCLWFWYFYKVLLFVQTAMLHVHGTYRAGSFRLSRLTC